ncbi:MAG: class I SAM-dependent methyltransferase [Thermoanaerobaculia bacterium]
MDGRADRAASLANLSAYDAEATRRFVEGAPHLKHAALRRLYAGLLSEVYERAVRHRASLRVLDLGAGEGSTTLRCLELGATVTAVDASESQLAALRARCVGHAERLHVRCEEVGRALAAIDDEYDIVIASAFLHHVPDYLGVIRRATELLARHGQILSFEDPLRYDTVGGPTRAFCALGYYVWRLSRGDLRAGLGRWLRRRRGVYLDASVHDNADYHSLRAGLDQEAIRSLLEGLGYVCRVEPYLSVQSRWFQSIGDVLGLHNAFAVVAKARTPASGD